MTYLYGVDGDEEVSIPLCTASSHCLVYRDGSARVKLEGASGCSLALTYTPQWAKSHGLADFGRAARMAIKRAVTAETDLSLDDFGRKLYEELVK